MEFSLATPPGSPKAHADHVPADESAMDAGSSIAAESAGTSAEVASHSAVPRFRGSGDLAEVMRRRRESCTEFESEPGNSTADAGAIVDEVQKQRSSASELKSWMSQMRGQCHVVQSAEEFEPVDAQTGNRDSGGSTVSKDGARRLRTSSGELQDWMQHMRDRCKILESTPAATTADACSEAVALPTQKLGATAASPHHPSSSSFSPALRQNTDASTDEAAAAMTLRLREGLPLPREARLETWAKMLPNSSTVSGSAVPPGLLQLLRVKEAGQTAAHVAAAFVAKHLSWSLCSADGGLTQLFALLAQLLRYHYPAAAGSMEATSKAAGFDLSESLAGACEEGGGLRTLLFQRREDADDTMLLLLCDLVVIEGERLLLLFVVVALLAEVVEPDMPLERLFQLVRGALGFSCLNRLDSSGIKRCIDRAKDLLLTTPLSFVSSLSVGFDSDLRLRLPICAIEPQEVLHHVYHCPSTAWRLVVVDVRMRASDWTLPVCIRVGQTTHSHRRQLLRDMPFQESVHVCLMGDGAVEPGDDAFELCRYLVGPRARRRHVSVVFGGWQAVEELAKSLNLDLLPLDTSQCDSLADTANATTEESTAAQQLAMATETAAAAAAEAAKHVANATEMAAAVGQQAARSMFAGAGRAFQFLSGNKTKELEEFESDDLL